MNIGLNIGFVVHLKKLLKTYWQRIYEKAYPLIQNVSHASKRAWFTRVSSSYGDAFMRDRYQSHWHRVARPDGWQSESMQRSYWLAVNCTLNGNTLFGNILTTKKANIQIKKKCRSARVQLLLTYVYERRSSHFHFIEVFYRKHKLWTDSAQRHIWTRSFLWLILRVEP